MSETRKRITPTRTRLFIRKYLISPSVLTLASLTLVLSNGLSAQDEDLTLIKSDSTELPSFNAVSGSTTQEERRIGAAWLKQYRRSAPVSSDPIINAYIEQLLEQLVAHSGLNNPQLSVVVTKNSSLNAFAVPGEVIGIHTGLLTHAKTEQQLISVLAHELAHLKQRHYARGVEKQKKQRITTMAALLASLVIAANTDNDAGIAALQTTQAYAIDQRLRFSRSFEAEADRIGMEIMVKAGMDPHATEQIFKQMERISRFSSEPPEFLLTHPLTNSRIVAAINDARQFKKKNFPENIDYQLVRARAILATQESPQQAISRFKSELSGFDTSLDGSQYGLAIAFTNNRQFQEADALINTLLDKHPLNTTLRIAKSNILVGLNQMPTAITLIQEQRKAQPEHHPLTMQLSQLHRAERKYSTAKRLLDELSEQRPNDPSVWYELAEVSGLDNDILLLHKARAEYFILYGDFANAEQQLNELATKTTEAAKNSPTKKTATLADYAQEKLRELPRLRRQAKL